MSPEDQILVLVGQSELRVVRLQARDVQVDVVMPRLVRRDVGQLPQMSSCATQTKFLQGLGLLEVVDVPEVVGEQMVKVLRRENEWCVVGWEGKRASAVVE